MERLARTPSRTEIMVSGKPSEENISRRKECSLHKGCCEKNKVRAKNGPLDLTQREVVGGLDNSKCVEW